LRVTPGEKLAAALYDLDFEAANHPFYPDAADVLQALDSMGRRNHHAALTTARWNDTPRA
jgi:hypothetical protein